MCTRVDQNFTAMATKTRNKRPLNVELRQSIHDLLADGVPRATIAAETGVNPRQVDAIRAHITIADRKKRLTDDEMLRRAHSYAKVRARQKKLRCLSLSDCKELWAMQGATRFR